MSDYASARASIIAAVDELDTWQGQPTLSSQLNSVTSLQAQNNTLTSQVAALNADKTTLTNERDSARRAVTAMKTAAQADKTADAANAAGQAVLDAATAEGL